MNPYNFPNHRPVNNLRLISEGHVKFDPRPKPTNHDKFFNLSCWILFCVCAATIMRCAVHSRDTICWAAGLPLSAHCLRGVWIAIGEFKR